MVKNTVKKLGAETSKLGFGAMRMPTSADGSIDYEAAGAMIDKAVAGGINYFDTAYVYHAQQSEVFLGDALVSRYPRDSFYIATKLPTFRVNQEKEIEEMLDESLRRLKTDYIDFYLMHAMDLELWKKVKSFGVIEKMEKAKKAGKIRRLGFSSHATPAEFQKIIDDYDKWEFVQLQINYADWDMRPDTKPTYEAAEKAGLPLVIMEPIRGGGLSDPNNPAVKHIAGKLPEGVTPAALALRWAAARPNAFVVLSGMSNLAQVEENLKTFAVLQPLSAEESALIDNAVAVLKGKPTVPCTACGYCLEGCPKQIPMDGVFESFNTYILYQNKQRYINFYPGEGRRPEDCIGCGACAGACPQHIDVPAELKRAAQAYVEVRA